jgi:hypothetical protein
LGSGFSNGFDGEFWVDSFEDSFIAILMIGVISVIDISSFHNIFDCVLEIVLDFAGLPHCLTQLISVFRQSAMDISPQHHILLMWLEVVADHCILVHDCQMRT